MGTSPRKPFRFSLYFQPIKKPKKLKMPKGAGLTKPMKLSADLADIVGKKEASPLNALSNCGLISRRTTSKTPRTSNFSTPTKRWLRFSEVTAFVPSVWPISSQLTCLKFLQGDLYLHTFSFMDRKEHLG